MFDAITRTAKGYQIIHDWLGSGGKCVAVDLAEARGTTCIHCPKNEKGNWIDRLKADVADQIREHLAVKNGIGLKVSMEDNLGFCKVCGCVNALKVWCPLTHILSHTSEKDIEEYPDNCWIKNETKAL